MSNLYKLKPYGDGRGHTDDNGGGNSDGSGSGSGAGYGSDYADGDDS